MNKYHFGWWEKDKEAGWCHHEICIKAKRFLDAFIEFKKQHGARLYKGFKNGTVSQLLAWGKNIKLEIRESKRKANGIYSCEEN